MRPNNDSGATDQTEEWSNDIRRVAVVTGSTSGIGRAIAEKFVRLGFDVLVHGGRSDQKLAESVEALRSVKPIPIANNGFGTGVSRKPEVEGILADFSDTKSLGQFIDSAWDFRNRIDVLVNNAGADLLTENTELEFVEKFQKLIRVDVESTLVISRDIANRMNEMARSSSNFDPGCFSICNVGWDQANQGMAGESGILFSGSKGAVMQMTKSLAQTYAPTIRVNCVAPGWIKTAWGKSANDYWNQRAKMESLMGRWGEPNDVANAVEFLCSEKASFISGQILYVNGGFRFHQHPVE